MKHEGLIESIRQRLLNLSRANGEAFDFTLSRYGVERFLYRLGKSDLADRFVLKGATLFHVWNRKLHRPTRDLDLLGSGPDDRETVRQSILSILLTECPEDGLAFDATSLVVESIRDDMSYGGARAKFRAMLGNVRIPVQVDVGFGDAVTPAPEVREFPVLLPGMPGVSLKTYPTCTVIAEKFEALVRLDAQNTDEGLLRSGPTLESWRAPSGPASKGDSRHVPPARLSSAGWCSHRTVGSVRRGQAGDVERFLAEERIGIR